ncbi:putative ribonuclease H-like domain-containing protein [Tanacetum coccineum]
MDVKSDFLYEKIEEEVYVCQPPGFEDPDFPDRVYKVEKALYGLHQAPRAWYETLSTYLLDNEFQRGKIDKTLFIKKYKGDILLVHAYVDDIIFGSTKKELCNAFEKLMHEKFQMSSMGELTFFLGLQVQQKKDGIFISQDKYGDEILKKFRFTEVKTASTPIETQKPLPKDEDGEEVDVHMYRSMIGSLMYLTSSRHDIMFAVCACARYQVNPKVLHLHVVKRIFRLISWQCKKQTVVANSITEAEYVAASSCFGQVLWIQNQLLDHGPKKKDTQVPQSSVPSDNVVDEAVYKELDDSLVRAAKTASSLEAEQDSGGGLRRQETIGDTIAQTRSENVSKLSNDPLPARVIDLETTKTTQGNEIASLKRRVKKLEKKDRSRTHKLKKLYKVGLSARIESSRDEEDLGEDASKQGRRIHDIDADEDITLVNDDNEIFDVDALAGEEVFVAKQSENVVEEIVDAAQTITIEEITLAQALAELKSAKLKDSRVVIQEPEQDTKPVVEQVKPMKRLEQMRIDKELAFKLQGEEEEEERLAKEKAQQVEEANIA